VWAWTPSHPRAIQGRLRSRRHPRRGYPVQAPRTSTNGLPLIAGRDEPLGFKLLEHLADALSGPSSPPQELGVRRAGFSDRLELSEQHRVRPSKLRSALGSIEVQP